MKRTRTVAPWVIGFIAGYLLCSWLHRLEPAPEPPAPAIELPSGGIVAERLPPPAQLPVVAQEAVAATGGTPVRVGQVVIQPDTPAPSAPVDGICICRPAPVTLDWALLDVADGYRFAVDAEGGTVTGAHDKPLVHTQREPRWSAMAYYLPTEKAGAVTLEREIWRGRVGVGAVTYDGRLVPMVGAGFSW